jgi:hypothetical protein
VTVGLDDPTCPFQDQTVVTSAAPDGHRTSPLRLRNLREYGDAVVAGRDWVKALAALMTSRRRPPCLTSGPAAGFDAPAVEPLNLAGVPGTGRR